MAEVVWVTGAGGLIGSHLVRSTPRETDRWQVHPLTRERLDLCDFAAVERAFRSERPGLIIHCAALTQSPACEADPTRAWRLNFQTTEHLANLAADQRFIFFSTDLVFDGRAGNYSEAAAVNPLSIYAQTKAAAEKVVLANPKHTVIRTSLNAGVSPTGDRSLNEQLQRAWQNGNKVRLFTDEYRSPIPASATAQAVWEIATQEQTGIWHVAGAERLSRWEIGQLVKAVYPALTPNIEPGSIRDYSGPPRPADTSLDCRKAQQLLSCPLPRFSEWVEAEARAPRPR